MKNWSGWEMIRDMKNRRINLSLFVLWKEIPYAQRFLNQVKTDRIDVILFIVDNRHPLKPNDNCINRFNPNTHKLDCIQLSSIIYPINILRNLAIERVDTAYYLNMDADIIPSRTIQWIDSIQANLYQSLRQMDFTPFINNNNAFIIPIFQFTSLYRSTCSDDSCFERMVTQIPQSTSQILQCMHNHQCQVANAYLTTHVMERNEYDE